ncbi:hypothetical protein ACP26L_35965 (plasmid) [Paenibacillus sp. S-38]|uniref:hypothetical protein n=1 Tax=Paenibacillus sp. S-38 TaxID=3416710 RepID=UPI003CE7CD20
MENQAEKREVVFCKFAEPGSGLVHDWAYDVVSRTGDMLFVSRSDGMTGFFPASYFRTAAETDFTEYLNVVMMEMEDARRVAAALGLSNIEVRLSEMKAELNDFAIDLAAEEDDDSDAGD